MFGNLSVFTTGRPSRECQLQLPLRQFPHVGNAGSIDPPVLQLHFCQPCSPAAHVEVRVALRPSRAKLTSSIETHLNPSDARVVGFPSTILVASTTCVTVSQTENVESQYQWQSLGLTASIWPRMIVSLMSARNKFQLRQPEKGRV